MPHSHGSQRQRHGLSTEVGGRPLSQGSEWQRGGCGECVRYASGERASKDPRASSAWHPRCVPLCSRHSLFIRRRRISCSSSSPAPLGLLCRSSSLHKQSEHFCSPAHLPRCIAMERFAAADSAVHLGFQDAGLITPAFAGCLVIIPWILVLSMRSTETCRQGVMREHSSWLRRAGNHSLDTFYFVRG